MNRFHKAWLALTGRLEPEVREVIVRTMVVGEPHVVTIYCVQVPDPEGGKTHVLDSVIWFKRTPVYYETCAQAHAEHPNEDVSSVKAIKAGDEYVISTESLRLIEVQPKPKRPKGKRA